MWEKTCDSGLTQEISLTMVIYLDFSANDMFSLLFMTG